ncbi:globin domain-containing protein [Mangrovibacterium marinum]|uniref:Hemoglobin-like flavoprotein n=1 Tax=Mangrovibacterium marinum TaxID=1639118 RepID=A0A2T5C1R0_9BACT|nr:globin domain-containing protein [Mangrovibacterium marinum]PTN08581.1 hemoglobin-like flavoprotein [Mangrovibacterium marinum]
MTEADITVIEKSYAQIEAALPRMAKYFFNRANELDSDLDPLFEEDKSKHGEAFVALFGKAVEHLNSPEALLPEIKKMEAKLKYYKFNEEVLNTVGVVFVDTLSFGFGNNFTQDIIDPWVKAYKTYSSLFFA